MIELAEKVETIHLLETHVSKYVAAYRKSYKSVAARIYLFKSLLDFLGGRCSSSCSCSSNFCSNRRGSPSWYKCCCK